MNQIKAIDTSYKGFLFRSRLEARWAVFFDAMGLDWEYEPEGFELPDGTRYLPDFCVQTPQGNPIWYEIKPKHVQRDAKHGAFSKYMENLSNQMHNEAYEAWRAGKTPFVEDRPWLRTALLNGDPVHLLGEQGAMMCPRCGLISHTHVLQHNEVYCFPCDTETSTGDMEHGPLNVEITAWKGWLRLEDEQTYWNWMRRIFEAASVARRARFEHGAQIPQHDSGDVVRMLTRRA